MFRRDVLMRTGLTVASAALAAAPFDRPHQAEAQAPDWSTTQKLFSLDPGWLHFGGLYLASHPTPVRQAIETHRRGLDDNPVEYLHQQAPALEAAVLRAAASYLGGRPTDIALTDSTTMGLGLLYTGLDIGTNQEIVTTQHDFYATHEALRYASMRSGAPMRQIALYSHIESVSADEIIANVAAALTERTRVLAITWVHSSTGLKLPLRAIADAVKQVNAARDPSDRVLLCVDGVHGFGVEDLEIASSGVDFFVAGCHKWLLGPRGTGLVWGNGDAVWSAVRPTIPTFGNGSGPGSLHTPGGFHSFEHRWALSAAFELHQQIGRARVAGRIHALNTQLKAGLASVPGVRLITPLAEELSAGLVCFEVAGLASQAVVDRLHDRGIMATVTPYATAYPRLAAGLMNDEQQVEQVVQAVQSIT